MRSWRRFLAGLGLAAAFLLPGFAQLLSRKARFWHGLLFLLGIGAFVNLASALAIIRLDHVAAFDPSNYWSYSQVFNFAPGSAGDVGLTPDSITIIAEVTPQRIRFERVSSIEDPQSLLVLQPHFWTYFAFFALLYLGCGILSGWNFARTKRSTA